MFQLKIRSDKKKASAGRISNKEKLRRSFGRIQEFNKQQHSTTMVPAENRLDVRLAHNKDPLT